MDERWKGEEVCEILGANSPELLAQARERAPGAHGPDLAAEALDILRGDDGPRRPRANSQDIRLWLYENGLLVSGFGARMVSNFVSMPGKMSGPSLKPSRSREEDLMSDSDLKWIGLAILMAAGGLVAYALKRPREQPAVPARKEAGARAPAVAPLTSVRVGVAAFSKTLRELESGERSAADLLTVAPFWCAGPRSQWTGKESELGLSRVDHPLSGDDTLMVVVFDLPPSSSAVPSSKPEAAMRLREASRANRLQAPVFFSMGEPGRLTDAGFSQ